MRYMILALTWLVLAAFPAAAQDAYQIKPGDTLRIEVLEDSNLNRTALVLPDGTIAMPMAGTIKATGRSVGDVQADLAKRIAPNFAATPNVYVSVDKLSTATPATGTTRLVDVYVLGEAGSPGHYEVKSSTTLLQFMAQMGGFSRFAATNRIQLLRTDRKGNQTTYALDLAAPANLAGRVQNGDVFIIPPRKLFE
jgi:polysaccharide biosynthesis/export protein